MLECKNHHRLFALILLVPTLGPQALAQTKAKPGSQNDDAPTCMVRTGKASNTSKSGEQIGASAILVVRKSAAELESKGFAVTDCGQIGLKISADVDKYRDDVCKLAQLGNEATQAQIYEALGEYPAVLCANAEKIAGSWDRKAAKSAQ